MRWAPSPGGAAAEPPSRAAATQLRCRQWSGIWEVGGARGGKREDSDGSGATRGEERTKGNEKKKIEIEGEG